jgi:hypothetical protein
MPLTNRQPHWSRARSLRARTGASGPEPKETKTSRFCKSVPVMAWSIYGMEYESNQPGPGKFRKKVAENKWFIQNLLVTKMRIFHENKIAMSTNVAADVPCLLPPSNFG